MTLEAKPQMNGNPPEHFEKAGRDLFDACQKLQAVLSDVHANVLHGRNYQHLGTGVHCESARRGDLARVQKLQASIEEGLRLGLHIYKLGQKEKA